MSRGFFEPPERLLDGFAREPERVADRPVPRPQRFVPPSAVARGPALRRADRLPACERPLVARRANASGPRIARVRRTYARCRDVGVGVGGRHGFCATPGWRGVESSSSRFAPFLAPRGHARGAVVFGGYVNVSWSV